MADEYANLKYEVSRQRKLAAIAGYYNNSMSNVIENLIDAEYARVFSRPNPCVTVQQAMTAEENSAPGGIIMRDPEDDNDECWGYDDEGDN